jgi:hypothetical protein
MKKSSPLPLSMMKCKFAANIERKEIGEVMVLKHISFWGK